MIGATRALEQTRPHARLRRQIASLTGSADASSKAVGGMTAGLLAAPAIASAKLARTGMAGMAVSMGRGISMAVLLAIAVIAIAAAGMGGGSHGRSLLQSPLFHVASEAPSS